MNKPIRIMLVEDHPTYRRVIEMALEDEPDMELCGTYGAAEVALRSVEYNRENRPDVILLDLNLPGMSGLEALPWFTKEVPNTKIIILSRSNNQKDVVNAIQRKAAGYLLKSSTVSQIKEGIRTVMDGGASLDSSIAQFILNELQKQPVQLELDKSLSTRELEILMLLGEGLVKKEIGDKLGIGYGSVATYIRRIYEKLHVVNAAAAVNKAHRFGLFPPEK